MNYTVLRSDMRHMIKSAARLKTITPVQAIDLFMMAHNLKNPQDVDRFLRTIPEHLYPMFIKKLKRLEHT